MKPIIAIIGRPNAGKSTLFNRITRTRDALVDNFPGVTRDRHYGDARWDGVPFTLVDTGGFTQGDEDGFSPAFRAQVYQAIEDADAVVLLLDGKSGVSPFDQDMANILRTLPKPVFYAVNKIDGMEREENLVDFYSLGVSPLFPLSAEHGYGIGDFFDAVVKALPRVEALPSRPPSEMTRVAVVGRPNVGKSSLINRLAGKERLLVSSIPGTTRDAIDTVCRINSKPYLLIDTAGIRRKGRVSKKLEKISIIKALRSLDRCDVALIVLDALEGITDQDISIAGYAHDRGCGCIFLLNKWDAVDPATHPPEMLYDHLRSAAKFLSFAPAVTVSALTGLRVFKVFKYVEAVYEQYASRLGTGPVNKILERALQRNEPPLTRGRRLKFYYAAQVSTKPPTFGCFVNYPNAVHFSYKRYLINRLRKEAGLDKTPIRLILRKRTGKKTGKKK